MSQNQTAETIEAEAARVRAQLVEVGSDLRTLRRPDCRGGRGEGFLRAALEGRPGVSKEECVTDRDDAAGRCVWRDPDRVA